MTLRNCIYALAVALFAISCGSAKFAGKKKKSNADVAPILCSAENNCFPKNICEATVKEGESCECDDKEICKIVPVEEPVQNEGEENPNQGEGDDGANQGDDEANQGDDDAHQGDDDCPKEDDSNNGRRHKKHGRHHG